MNTPQELTEQMVKKTDQELKDMFAKQADWSPQALDAARAELSKRGVNVEAVAAQPQRGSCPKCSKTDIQRPFTWGAFAASIVLLFLGGALIQAFQTHMSLPIEILCDVLSLGLLAMVVWTFFSALRGKNRCKACGHKWKGKAGA
jgi:hypothetical protein